MSLSVCLSLSLSPTDTSRFLFISEVHKDSPNPRINKNGSKYGSREILEEKNQGENSAAYREGGHHNQLEATRFQNGESTNLKELGARGFEDKWLFHDE